MIDVLVNLMKAIADHQKLTIDFLELLNSSLNQAMVEYQMVPLKTYAMMVEVLVEELKATDEQQKLKVDVLELSKLWQK